MTAAEHLPARTVAHDFLANLYSGVDDGWLTLFGIDRRTGERRTGWRTIHQLPQLVTDAEHMADDCCVWFGVATRTANVGGRGTAADCAAIPALWLDIDIAGPNHVATDLPATYADAWRLIADFPLPPTVVVRTGGGLQPYWVLQEPLEADQASRMLTRWGATWSAYSERHGWSLDNVFDLPRVLRLPGTYNRKNEPTLVTVDSADWTRRYGIDDLDQWLIDPPAAPERDRKRDVPYIGPERPGDAYNARTKAHDLLVATGWVFDHTDRQNGDDHYRAPHHADERGNTGATVYADDGHITIWSDTFARQNGLQTKRPYDPFGYYVAVKHNGDFRAASDELEAAGYGTKEAIDPYALIGQTRPADSPSDPPRSPSEPPVDYAEEIGANLVDWDQFWAQDHNEAQWIAEPFIAENRAHSIFAIGGTGKSLLALWLAVRIALGQPIFGRATVARTVLYMDYEMTAADLYERLDAMGYGPDTDLSNLRYAMLPNLPPLDTEAGGSRLRQLAAHVQADVVIVDTYGRAVEGDENDADTTRAFYRHAGMGLKSDGRAWVRIDHAGKDVAKGQRGSSAKNDDVDIVWQMTVTDDGYRMKATKRRMGWVPETVDLIKRDDPYLGFEAAQMPGVPAGTKAAIELLDRLDVPVIVSHRDAARMVREAGEKVRNNVLRAAVRARRERPDLLVQPVENPVESVPKSSGHAVDDKRAQTDGARVGTNHKTPGQKGGHAVGHTGAHPCGPACPKCAPLKGAHRAGTVPGNPNQPDQPTQPTIPADFYDDF